MNADFLLAAIISTAVILSSPVAGQITVALRTALPNQFVLLLTGGMGVLLAAAVGIGLFRVRERRAERYGLIAASILLAALYARAASSGTIETDVVERFHFFEYGLIAWAFHRAFRQAGGNARFVAPLLCAVLVAIADEWVQWFVPIRIGEARDVTIDLVAIVCGLLFSAGLADSRQSPAISHQSSVASHQSSVAGCSIAALAAAVVLFFAAFVDTVHLGYDVDGGSAGRFVSRSSKADLLAASADRAARWRLNPPTALRRFSREDQYLTEGIWHIQWRNMAESMGDGVTAWHENLILESFYAPVLDEPSFLAPHSSRWTAAQRDSAAQAAASGEAPYISGANRSPILVWPKWAFRLAALLLAFLLNRVLRAFVSS